MQPGMTSGTDTEVPGAAAAPTDLLVLTDRDRSVIARRATVGLFRALSAQALTMLLAVLGAWRFAAFAAAASAWVRAAASFVPKALFALRLLFGTWDNQRG